MGDPSRTKNGRYFADDGFIRGSLTRLPVSTFVFAFFLCPLADTLSCLAPLVARRSGQVIVGAI
jgi:hypothetical protein